LLAADADGWLGSTAGITEDGWNITVVRFTSEQDARRFEPVAPVEADEPAREERRRLITDLRCFDLRDRQLLSPSSLGALDSVDVEQGLGVALQQALGSVMTLLEVERAGLMLVDEAGALGGRVPPTGWSRPGRAT
jgi:hypothetical protein